MKCYQCHKEIEVDGKLSFRADCEHCGFDAHVCLNCHFYDAGSYNECRETSADRVTDKEKNNHCEYFQAGTGGAGGSSEVDDAKKKLEELFKK